MWNSQVGGLLAGATICIYDGNRRLPGPTGARCGASSTRNGITFFGAGAAFYRECMKAGVEPRRRFDLSALRALGSTGSPLSDGGLPLDHRPVERRRLDLVAISGGTDSRAPSSAACPMLPVYAGEMQCRALGAAVDAFDDAGRPRDRRGRRTGLHRADPSMPLYFWSDAGNKRYLESYFDTYPGVWRHGDWLQITRARRRASSTAARDSTINRHGIRMGTAELYRVVEELPEVLDSLVVDLEYLGRESCMPLFVVLRDGDVLDDALTARIDSAIRTALSPGTCPNEIFAVAEVPRTLTGKKSRCRSRSCCSASRSSKVANRDAMANPDSWTGTSITRGVICARPARRRPSASRAGGPCLAAPSRHPALASPAAPRLQRRALSWPCPAVPVSCAIAPPVLSPTMPSTPRFRFDQDLIRIGDEHNALLLAPGPAAAWCAGSIAAPTSCTGPTTPTGRARRRSVAAIRCCFPLSAAISSTANRANGAIATAWSVPCRSTASRATCRSRSRSAIRRVRSRWR